MIFCFFLLNQFSNLTKILGSPKYNSFAGAAYVYNYNPSNKSTYLLNFSYAKKNPQKIYPLFFTGWVLKATLSPNYVVNSFNYLAPSRMLFGSSVSIQLTSTSSTSSSAVVVAVGAIWDSEFQSEGGAVYLYESTDNTTFKPVYVFSLCCFCLFQCSNSSPFPSSCFLNFLPPTPSPSPFLFPFS